jgi:membrane protease YdiL (CAAX protease family)
MQKRSILLLGTVTLLVFPIPALLALWFFEDLHPLEVLAFPEILNPINLIGLAWGIFYALLGLFAFQGADMNDELGKQKRLLRGLKLNLAEKSFLSFCAGFGEEMLFRAGVQHWLGVFVTSVLFVAIHGYLNPKKKTLFKYGLLLLPFIFSLGYFLEEFGIWFAISAHFSYDLVLFIVADYEEED